MKKLGTLLLGMFAVLPVYAQDQAADAAAPAEAAPADAASAPAADAAPADAAADAAAPADASSTAAAPADAPAADASAAAPADAAAAPAADTPPADAAAAPAADAAAPAADAAATDSAAPAADASAAPAADAAAAPAEAAPAEPAAERKPWQLYAGYDYSQVNFLASSSDTPPTPNRANQFSNNNLHGNFHQVRAGLRVFDVVGIEAHYGVKAGSGDKPDTMGVKNTMGLYFVPTGSLFDVVEISALIGYASTKLEHGGKTLSVHGSSYGANIELPLRPLFGEWMPDIRIGGGILMLHHDSESRIYGTHYGLRYDFKV
jgi:hypothetical protein